MKFTKTMCALVVAALVGVSGAAQAEWKPTKNIDAIVHTGPGGGNDVLARAIAQMLEKEKLLPVRMNIINKPGGNGAVAAAAIFDKKGDPHTIGLISTNWLANALTTNEAKITLHDLTPVAGLMTEPAVIVVRADSPYKTLKDFLDAAKAKPGTLKQSGGSVTARDNIVRQALQAKTGGKWVFVSFPGGGERIAALLGGHVDMMVIEPQEAGEQVRAGKMRVLAQIAAKPLAGYPGVPTMKEAGYDIPLIPQIRAIMGPPEMSKDVLAYYEDLFARLRKTASWKKYVEDNQFEDGYTTSAELDKWIKQLETDMRTQFQAIGIKTVR